MIGQCTGSGGNRRRSTCTRSRRRRSAAPTSRRESTTPTRRFSARCTTSACRAPSGKLSKMSFVCPNGTIFSQSSRVCSPYDRVYCALAERFYENVMGAIDTDKEYYHSLRVDAPRLQRHRAAARPGPPGQAQATPDLHPATDSDGADLRNSGAGCRPAEPLLAAAIQVPPLVPAGVFPANPVSGAGTPPVGPPPIPTNAVSAGGIAQQTAPPTLAPQQPQNFPGSAFRLPQRQHLRRPGASLATTTTTPPPSTAEYEYYDYEEETKTAAPRSKRAAAVPVKLVLPPNRHASVAQTSFSCQDKVAGGVYADPETDCQLFHICVPVGKGKLLDYGLLCDEGTAFNQETGTCDERDSFSCARSLQFTRTDKTKKFLADKKPWAYPKFNKRVVRDVGVQEDVESRSAEVREHGKTVGGYYADVETGCRMFHICAHTDMRFLCTNGTVFDQKALVCKNEDEVRCEDSPKHYVNGLTRFLERQKLRPEEDTREQMRADAYEITKVKNKYPKKVGHYKLRRYL
ncbi:hypothetical protein MTO96_024255 [Rhipicephalus appendiculatus]